jgi:hypothetical protein
VSGDESVREGSRRVRLRGTDRIHEDAVEDLDDPADQQACAEEEHGGFDGSPAYRGSDDEQVVRGVHHEGSEQCHAVERELLRAVRVPERVPDRGSEHASVVSRRRRERVVPRRPSTAARTTLLRDRIGRESVEDLLTERPGVQGRHVVFGGLVLLPLARVLADDEVVRRPADRPREVRAVPFEHVGQFPAGEPVDAPREHERRLFEDVARRPSGRRDAGLQQAVDGPLVVLVLEERGDTGGDLGPDALDPSEVVCVDRVVLLQGERDGEFAEFARFAPDDQRVVA